MLDKIKTCHVTQVFRTLYLGWVQKKNESTAYCTYCAKDINISNMGEAALAIWKERNIG